MSGSRAGGVADSVATVQLTQEVAEAFFLTRLSVDDFLTQAEPGQFVQLRPRAADELTPFLRIPLSIAAVDAGEGTVDVLYERVGPKTTALSRLCEGDRLGCIGPLGNAFPAPLTGDALLVGGGIGIPPLLFLGKRLRGDGRGVTLLAGARRAGKHLPDPILAPAADTFLRATDDGSLGHSGLITDLLVEALPEGTVEPAVYTCGPHAMMAAVARICAERGVTCHASLEEYMACGFGVCVGCVVPRADEDRGPYEQYSRVCVDGPVYDARTISW
jgi:dihydroorotate dehydrogenase electron transfer subunit